MNHTMSLQFDPSLILTATACTLCTGAECPRCSAFPTHRGALSAAYPSAGKQFTDSRGVHVHVTPKILLPSTTVIVQSPHVDYSVHHGARWNVLCHKRADNGYWGFPGGAQEIGESIVDAAKREFLEETNLHIEILGVVAIDSDPTRGAICAYHDNAVQYTNVTFVAAYVSGILMPSSESLLLRWCDTNDLPQPFLPTHLWRLQQAMHHNGAYVSVR